VNTTTLLASRPTHVTQHAAQDHLDVLRADLARSIARVKAERERIRQARDSISPTQRRFDSDGHRVWLQLDDWLNGLDAAITDAPELVEEDH
jgi:hypothetical protein